jgi:pimeloyl-ACP methyl ester carboxylesterase
MASSYPQGADVAALGAVATTVLRVEGSTVRTSDGVEIATYDLGGDGPPLLLAHATGFHGLVWPPLAAHLRARFRCVAFDHRGHGRSGKDPSGIYEWSSLVLDPAAVIAGLELGQPYAVGHSMGGGVLLLAEQAAPGTFRKLYCYEPVVLPVVEGPPEASSLPLAPAARRRREIFASREAAHANYADKAPFSTFDPAVVQLYVDHGFEDLADGTVRLRCRGEDEARVYEAAMRHTGWVHLPEIEAPVTVACGGEDAHFNEDAVTAMAARIPEGRAEVLASLGHFGPLEDPALVAGSILAAMDRP